MTFKYLCHLIASQLSVFKGLSDFDLYEPGRQWPSVSVCDHGCLSKYARVNGAQVFTRSHVIIRITFYKGLIFLFQCLYLNSLALLAVKRICIFHFNYFHNVQVGA